MTNTELILNMLAEASSKDISAATNPETYEDSKKVAKQGGTVAKVARKELEARTGKKVVTSLNAKSALQLQSANTKSRKNNGQNDPALKSLIDKFRNNSGANNQQRFSPNDSNQEKNISLRLNKVNPLTSIMLRFRKTFKKFCSNSGKPLSKWRHKPPK